MAVELVQVSLPLVTPLRAAHGEERDRQVVLVRAVDADGAEGWGECAALARPTYTHEHTDGAWRVLRDELVPAALAGTAPAVRTHPMAAAALADARLDLALRRVGASLVEVIGGGAGPLERTAVVGRHDDLGALRARVDEVADGGAAMVKLKVDPTWATVPARAVGEHRPDLPLAVDANASLAGHPDLLRELDALGLAYLEQPLAAGDLVGTAALARSLATPVALDESATDVDLLAAAAALGAGAIVNVKPARLGGVVAAVAVVARSDDLGLGWFVGGMLETGVGRSAALAVAALPGPCQPTDLGPSAAYLAEDVTEPLLATADGRVEVPGGPGACRHPLPERLAAAAVRRLVLR